jgi:hypothetical protein
LYLDILRELSRGDRNRDRVTDALFITIAFGRKLGEGRLPDYYEQEYQQHRVAAGVHSR